MTIHSKSKEAAIEDKETVKDAARLEAMKIFKEEMNEILMGRGEPTNKFCGHLTGMEFYDATAKFPKHL